MGTAASEHDSLHNANLTAITGLARALEDGNRVLHITFTAVWLQVSVYTGAFAFNAHLEHLANRRV